jgi:hypothetical protein
MNNKREKKERREYRRGLQQLAISDAEEWLTIQKAKSKRLMFWIKIQVALNIALLALNILRGIYV